MPDCERCGQMPGPCRQCRLWQIAERLYLVKLTETMRLKYHSDVTHLGFELLPEADRLGWLAVADAAVTMER